MKKLMMVLMIMVVCLLPGIVSAQDYTYAGRFYLRRVPPIAHNADMFLVNHLISHKGEAPEGYMPYDVYYMHDHATDRGDYSLEYANQRFEFAVRIVPLNIYNKDMGMGLYAGTINCKFVIAAQGVYGVRVKDFFVTDTKKGNRLFSASGDFGSEQLCKESAAEAILKMSGDHPVDGGKSENLRGYGTYPFR